VLGKVGKGRDRVTKKKRNKEEKGEGDTTERMTIQKEKKQGAHKEKKHRSIITLTGKLLGGAGGSGRNCLYGPGKTPISEGKDEKGGSR